MSNFLRATLFVVCLLVVAYTVVDYLPESRSGSEIGTANGMDISLQTASQSSAVGSERAVQPSEMEQVDSVPGLASGVAAHSGGALFKKVFSEEFPDIRVASVLVSDLETGEIYASIHPDMRYPTASLTKLITAAYAIDNIPMNTLISLGPELLSHIGDDGDTRLKTGDIYTADDLIGAMMTFSSNDAAEALASYVGREAFIAGMNALVKRWSLGNTHFDDPTGLSASNQSTSFELAQVLLRVYKEYPDVLEATRRASCTLAEYGSGVSAEYGNINEFVWRADFLGGKTGYTDEAGGNLISLFAYENRPIVVVILGTADRFGDTEKVFSWFKRTHTSK